MCVFVGVKHRKNQDEGVHTAEVCAWGVLYVCVTRVSSFKCKYVLVSYCKIEEGKRGRTETE